MIFLKIIPSTNVAVFPKLVTFELSLFESSLKNHLQTLVRSLSLDYFFLNYSQKDTSLNSVFTERRKGFDFLQLLV